jgi:hypothetical protein
MDEPMATEQGIAEGPRSQGPSGASSDGTNIERKKHEKRHPLRNGWLIGIVTGLVTGTMVTFFLSPTGQAGLTAVRDHLTKPTCDNPQWLMQVPDDEIFSSAYYMQHDTIQQYGLYHTPENTVDGNLTTSWLQIWPSPTTSMGPRSSDYIEWTFPYSYDLRLICIVNGWTEDSITYKQTLPIGSATVYATNPGIQPPNVGSPVPITTCPVSTAVFRDYDTGADSLGFIYQWQPVAYRCLTRGIVLHIDSVASASNRPDLAISEVVGANRGHLVGLSEVRFYYCPALLCKL